MIVIYKITSPTNKIYIGQTWDWEKRKYNYSNLECKGQKKLYNSLKKYGFKAHKIEFLLILPNSITQEMLNFYEIYWWKYYKNLGYNMLNIKEPGSNGRHSEETLQKMRGKSPSKETREKISKSLTGREMPKEIREKISKSNMGRKMSEKMKIRWSEYNKLPKKPESIEKMRDKLKGRKLSPIHIQKYKNRWLIPIIMLTLDGQFFREFNSTKEVQDFLKLKSLSGISMVLSKSSNRRKTVGGYKLIYKKDYDPSKSYVNGTKI